RGRFLGDFKGEDRILTLYRNGDYRLSSFDLSNHFDEDMVHLEKWNPHRPISCVYFDAEKEINFVKRFLCEIQSDKRVSFISESEGSYLQVVSTAYRPEIKVVFNKLLKETKNLPDQVLNLADLIDVKGMKAQGNQVTKLKVKEIVLTHEIAEGKEPWPVEDLTFEVEGMIAEEVPGELATLSEDGSIEWDISSDDQPTLFD
ncbi:MAG: DNA gyrase/topoisomerase IV subunit A, partial [Flavobacteriales bacterium]